MSFITSMFDSSKGSGFQAQSANILNPVTAAQANQSYDQAQGGLAQQQAFLKALQGQNGIQNQSNVYNQLANVAAGQGPNPAQAALAQATGNNIANQAALMAGQRGANSNVGLLARQNAMAGANAQQQAAGQAASLQAQQSLNALNSMGSLANQQVGQQQNALNAYNSGAQNLYGQNLQGIQAQNSANVANQSNINNANAGIAQSNIGAQQGLTSGLLNAAGSAMLLSHGGEVPPHTGGGPKSKIGKYFHSLGPAALADGGAVANLKENYSDSKLVPGDSPKNDVVPAMLSPKEIVLPRSVTMSPDAPEKASKFVAAILAKNKLKGK